MMLDAAARSTAGGSGPRPRKWRRRAAYAGAVLVAVLFAVQFVPYGHSFVPVGHPSGNPPVTQAAVWPDAAAQQIAATSCYDCHSNTTRWWWATKIAPGSWLAQNDVDGGRRTLNFSEWNRAQAALDDVLEAIDSGGMPPLQYKLLHSSAALDDAERRRLAGGIRQLYSVDPPAAIKQGG